MTRDEEIREAAGQVAIRDNKGQYAHGFLMQALREAFTEGAEWADGHPRWISVEDELPKMETEVLMVSSGCTDTLFGYRCKAGKNGWYCYNDDDYWHNITHWQHLPQPPKEGGEQ